MLLRVGKVREVSVLTGEHRKEKERECTVQSKLREAFEIMIKENQINLYQPFI